jgi:TatD DNase family protein
LNVVKQPLRGHREELLSRKTPKPPPPKADFPLVDTHLHLSWDTFEGQEDAVLGRAREAGVAAVIDLGTDLASSHKAMEHAERFENVWFAAGIHPNDSAEAHSGDLAGIRELLKHPKCVALGEIGLDFYRDYAAVTVQEAFLRSQLELAIEVNKPVVLHDREASELLLQVLEDVGYDGLSGPGGVFHCFAGDVDMVEEIVRRGFYLSFTGNITFKNTDRVDVVKVAPLDRLMVETDAPFMAPVPHRGKPNEPAWVTYVAAGIASIQDRSLDEVAAATTRNACRLFHLPEFDDHRGGA